MARHMVHKDGLICDLRKQIVQKEKALQAFLMQKTQFEDAVRNMQNGKPYRPLRVESPMGRNQGREELHLVREAIASLRANFRETDPSQHTLDTLEQAISVLMERSCTPSSSSNTATETANTERKQTNGICESNTKIIYFTDRTVTPFMTTVNRRLGEVTLRDFKSIFDRPGCFRFHFKNHDPEYGLVKEEVINDDDILPGVDGKIIVWVEEDTD